MSAGYAVCPKDDDRPQAAACGRSWRLPRWRLPHVPDRLNREPARSCPGHLTCAALLLRMGRVLQWSRTDYLTGREGRLTLGKQIRGAILGAGLALSCFCCFGGSPAVCALPSQGALCLGRARLGSRRASALGGGACAAPAVQARSLLRWPGIERCEQHRGGCGSGEDDPGGFPGMDLAMGEHAIHDGECRARHEHDEDLDRPGGSATGRDWPSRRQTPARKSRPRGSCPR